MISSPQELLVVLALSVSASWLGCGSYSPTRL